MRSFASSGGGIGGCPFAPGAAGNLGTDDNNGACNSFTTLENADYFTERVDASDQDLANTSVTDSSRISSSESNSSSGIFSGGVV